MFSPFGSQHLVTLVIGFAAIAGLLLLGKAGGTSRKAATWTLALLNLGAYPANLLAWNSLGLDLPLDNFLPLHLCDLAAIFAGIALLTRHRLLSSLTYFWGLAATIQGLITPALSHGFPSPPFFTFFIQHFTIVGAALYLPIVQGWRPKSPLWRSPLEVLGIGIIYQLSSLGINAVLDTNFGFSMHPPENPSLLDHLGPWPWYLFSMQAIAIVLFLLLALPFCSNQKSKIKNQKS